MPMKWTPTDENFCEEIRKVMLSLNNPIQKLDGLVTNVTMYHRMELWGVFCHQRREKYHKPRISNGPLHDEPGRCVWEINQTDKCLRATGSPQKLSSHCVLPSSYTKSSRKEI